VGKQTTPHPGAHSEEAGWPWWPHPEDAVLEYLGTWVKTVSLPFQPSKALDSVDSDEDSALVTLSFALCVLGRRTLGTASHNMAVRYPGRWLGFPGLVRGPVVYVLTASICHFLKSWAFKLGCWCFFQTLFPR
jgi:hypothetical protein